MSSAEELAASLASGEEDLERNVKAIGGSGKNRTKLEQHEHKKPHPEGDTRRIVEVALHGEQKRRDEAINRREKRDSK